jgi:hypothetical protein
MVKRVVKVYNPGARLNQRLKQTGAAISVCATSQSCRQPRQLSHRRCARSVAEKEGARVGACNYYLKARFPTAQRAAAAVPCLSEVLG